MNRRRFLQLSSSILAENVFAMPGRLYSQETAAKSSIVLVEGAAAAGLDFVVRNGATGRKYQVETLPGGLAVIDFDGDGWPDLFCTNGAALPSLEKESAAYSNRLYRNNRDGSFSDVTARAGLAGRGYSMGAAVGDYDNDGHEDIFVAGVHGNFLYHNNGDGTFSDVTLKAGLGGPGSLNRPAWSIAGCWIDYDHDGHLDLLVSNYCDWKPGTDPVCGGLDPSSREYCHPDKYGSQPAQLYHNNGDGTFTEVTRKQGLPDLLGKGMGVAMGDFDGNGSPGLFIANDNARNLLLRNRSGKLEEIGIEAGVAYNEDGRTISGMGADFADIDGDGRPDIVMTGLKNEGFDVFLNRGNTQFDDGAVKTNLLRLSRPWSGWGCGLVDLDNDGRPDLFVAAGGLDVKDVMPNQVFYNAGGRFVNVSEDAGPGKAQPALHRGAVFADFDRDGRIDIAVSALNQPIELWWNRTRREGGHWLQLRLKGRSSNCSAIGAVVHCTTASSSQSHSVTSSVGYASSSDLTVHFGLGKAEGAVIQIHWPSGVVQTLGQVSANQRLAISEPGPAH